jgi:zinc/manganese transport system substrate-binding protein
MPNRLTALAIVVLMIAALCLAPVVQAPAAPVIGVVAAENFYGDVVQQIAGNHVKVTSILSDPNVDPHEYETNSADAIAVANARLVIQSGIGYDSFIDHLVKASPNPRRTLVVVAALTGHRDGDNPHLWYQPATMPKVARVLTAVLIKIDPADAAYYRDGEARFLSSLEPLTRKIAAIKTRYGGAPVAYTEPVFGYMGEALGLHVLTSEAFQKAVEDGNDPPAAAIASMETDLRAHRVKVLLYNVQTVTPITTRIQRLAKQSGISVVGVSETEPPGKTYQQWMLSQLDALEQALASGK